MAFCINCGQELVDGAKFCCECGTPVTNKLEADKASLDVDISIQVVLKGVQKESTDMQVYLPHLNKAIAVKIPNSVSVGQALRLPGLGRSSPAGQKGDAYLYIAHIEQEIPRQENKEPHEKWIMRGKCESWNIVNKVDK